jgi:hypothetical protein
MDLVALSSARLKDVILTGPDEVIEPALAELRFARMRFLEARADYLEICQLLAWGALGTVDEMPPAGNSKSTLLDKRTGSPLSRQDPF